MSVVARIYQDDHTSNKVAGACRSTDLLVAASHRAPLKALSLGVRSPRPHQPKGNPQVNGLEKLTITRDRVWDRSCASPSWAVNQNLDSPTYPFLPVIPLAVRCFLDAQQSGNKFSLCTSTGKRNNIHATRLHFLHFTYLSFSFYFFYCCCSLSTSLKSLPPPPLLLFLLHFLYVTSSSFTALTSLHLSLPLSFSLFTRFLQLTCSLPPSCASFTSISPNPFCFKWIVLVYILFFTHFSCMLLSLLLSSLCLPKPPHQYVSFPCS